MYKVNVYIYELGSDENATVNLMKTESKANALTCFVNASELVIEREAHAVGFEDWTSIVAIYNDAGNVVCTKSYSHMSPKVLPGSGWEDFIKDLSDLDIAILKEWR